MCNLLIFPSVRPKLAHYSAERACFSAKQSLPKLTTMLFWFEHKCMCKWFWRKNWFYFFNFSSKSKMGRYSTFLGHFNFPGGLFNFSEWDSISIFCQPKVGFNFHKPGLGFNGHANNLILLLRHVQTIKKWLRLLLICYRPRRIYARKSRGRIQWPHKWFYMRRFWAACSNSINLSHFLVIWPRI